MLELAAINKHERELCLRPVLERNILRHVYDNVRLRSRNLRQRLLRERRDERVLPRGLRIRYSFLIQHHLPERAVLERERVRYVNHDYVSIVRRNDRLPERPDMERNNLRAGARPHRALLCANPYHGPLVHQRLPDSIKKYRDREFKNHTARARCGFVIIHKHAIP